MTALQDVRNIASGDKDGDIIGDNNSDITGENVDSTRVMELLRNDPAITTALLTEKTGFSTRMISRIMKALRENGLIVRVGSTRKGYWEIVQK